MRGESLEIAVKARWEHKPGKSPGSTTDADSGPGTDNVIRCARCGHVITHARCRIKVLDLHEHAQVNPGGYVWHFACFSEAPGGRPIGSPSTEFAWFPGATWQIFHCGSCDLHLGWRFAYPDHAFYGLIIDRIHEANE